MGDGEGAREMISDRRQTWANLMGSRHVYGVGRHRYRVLRLPQHGGVKFEVILRGRSSAHASLLSHTLKIRCEVFQFQFFKIN